MILLQIVGAVYDKRNENSKIFLGLYYFMKFRFLNLSELLNSRASNLAVCKAVARTLNLQDKEFTKIFEYKTKC